MGINKAGEFNITLDNYWHYTISNHLAAFDTQPTWSSAPVPVFLIQCSGFSLPHSVFQIQSTLSSAAVPVYLIQCFGSMQSASSSVPVPVYIPHPVSNSSLFHSLLQFQSSPSSATVPATLSSASDPVYFIPSVLWFHAVYLIQCSSSSVPRSVLWFQSPIPVYQSSWSSALVPVYLFQCLVLCSQTHPKRILGWVWLRNTIPCCSSILPHPVLQFQSSAPSLP